MFYLSSFIPSNSNFAADKQERVSTKRSISNVLLGVVSAAIAFPLVAFAIALSVFLPQEKWEEFWDKFLEV